MLRRLTVILLIITVGLSACKPGTTKPQVSLDSETLVQESAWLNQKLPANTYAYVRIPNTWNFFSARGDSFQYAQGNEAHVQQLKQLQTALINYLDEELIGSSGKLLSDLVLKHMTSPLEVAAYAPEGSPFPYGLASVYMNYPSATAINSLLDELAEMVPVVTITQPFTEEGKAIVDIGMVSVLLQYTAEKQLTMFAGMGVNEQIATKQIEQFNGESSEAFTSFEQQVDSSGKGSLVWVNTEILIPMVEAFMPEQAAELKKIGITDVTSLGFGMGTANGKGRLRAVINAPATSKLHTYLPQNPEHGELKTVGSPSMVALMSVPNKAQLTGIATAMMALAPESGSTYSDFEELSMEYIGFDVLDWFDSYGNVVIFKDDIGTFAAQHIRNPAAFKQLANTLFENGKKLTANTELMTTMGSKASAEYWEDLQLNTHEVKNQTIYHLTVPSFLASTLGDEITDAVPSALYSLAAGGNVHLYWMIDGDHIVIAKLPQQLIERARSKKTDSVQNWQNENGLTQTNSVLALSGVFQGGKQEIYHYYLSGLAGIADAIDAEFDIFAFPTASELALSSPGLASFQIDKTANSLAVELTYEKTPFDALLMADTGMAMIATTGILAAVAVPAYQDYTVRADITNIINESEVITDELTDYYNENGTFPDEGVLENYEPTIDNDKVNYIEVEADSGLVMITINKNYQADDDTIWLSPIFTDDGEVYYDCESTLKDSQLPYSCK